MTLIGFNGADGKGKSVSTTDRLPVDIGAATVNIDGSFSGIEESLGAPSDAAANSDSATSGLIGLVKRLLGKLPSSFQQGGGAITSTTTRVTLATDGPGVTSLSSIDTKTPALQSGAVPVGDNSGSLTVDGKAYRVQLDITRPSNTTAYTAGDVIGVADTGTPANAGSAIHTLTNIGPSGGYVLIQSAELFIGNASVPAGMSGFRLHLYTASPTAILDNAAFDLVSGEVGNYVGFVDLPAPQDLGSILYTQADYSGRLIKLASASTSLFAELQTIGAYTPASGTVYTLRVKTLEAGL